MGGGATATTDAAAVCAHLYPLLCIVLHRVLNRLPLKRLVRGRVHANEVQVVDGEADEDDAHDER